MEQKANLAEHFGAAPSGPYSILRLLATARPPEAPAEIAAIARVDMMLDDMGWYVGEIWSAAFGRRTGGSLTDAPACTPGDIARAAWEPFAPDLLVAHDLSVERLSFPPAITGYLPWIGTLRVACRAWDAATGDTASEIIAHRTLPYDGGPAQADGSAAKAERGVLEIAALVQAMVASQDVRCWASTHGSAAHALRPLLGDLPADYALQAMLDMSATGVPASRNWPGPWDTEAAWRALPLDDLLQFAGSASDDSGGMAVAEVHRRNAGSPIPQALPSGRVLLRRVQFGVPEGGRCDGW